MFYVDVKSERLRDILRTILQDVMGICLREDKPTVYSIPVIEELDVVKWSLTSIRSSGAYCITASRNWNNTDAILHI